MTTNIKMINGTYILSCKVFVDFVVVLLYYV